MQTLSYTKLTNAPDMAIKKVPGSISKCNCLPVSLANFLNSSATGSPIFYKSVVVSYGLRPTLYPPPKLHEVTVCQYLQNSNDLIATSCQILGSDPEPI